MNFKAWDRKKIVILNKNQKILKLIKVMCKHIKFILFYPFNAISNRYSYQNSNLLQTDLLLPIILLHVHH